MKKSILLILILGLATLACSFSGATATAPTESIGVETQVAGTMQALTAAAPPPTATPNGIPVSSNEATFLIPNGLAGNASAASSTEVNFPTFILPSGRCRCTPSSTWINIQFRGIASNPRS
jgi:hypothetical protein